MVKTLILQDRRVIPTFILAGLGGAAIILISLWATVARASVQDIHILSSGFAPASLTINAGDTVRFINDTNAIQNVSSNDHPNHTLYPQLNLGDFAPAEIKLVTSLTAVGSYGYHNHLDPSKTGWIYVTSGGTSSPNAPSGLVATSITSSYVNVAWTDNAGNETHFNLEREIASTASWITLISPGMNVATYTDTSVTAGTTYNYRIQACATGSGCSAYTYLMGVVIPTAGGDTTAPSVPTGLYATPISATQINVSWTASSDSVGVVGYKIYRCQCGNVSNATYLATVTSTSYSDTNLLSATTYTYAVAAVDAANNISAQTSGYSATTFASAGGNNPPSPPPYVSGPTAATINTAAYYYVTLYADYDGNQVKAVFDWGDGTTSETAFIQPATSGSSSPSISHMWNTSGTYQIRAKAKDSTGLESGWTPNFSVSVSGGTSTDVTLPGVPSGLALYSASSGSVTLQWTASGDDGTSGTVSAYDIRYSTTSPSSGNLETWFSGAISAASPTFDPATFSPGGSIQRGTVYGLTSGTVYYFALRARDEVYNWSPVSNYISASATGGTATDIPNAPGSLYAPTIQYNQVQLSWTDNSSNELGFKVFRRLSTDSVWSATYFTVGANVLTYTDTAVSASTSYQYKVLAYNNTGASGDSNIITVTTPAAIALGGTPATPTGLQFSLSNNNTVTLSWTDAASNEDGFRIFRKLSSDFWTSAYYASVPLNVMTYGDSAVSPGMTYNYKVVAYNSSGISGESNTVIVTIPTSGAESPNAPTSLRQEGLPSGMTSGIALRWDDNATNEDKFNVYRRVSGQTTFAFLTQLLGSNITSYVDTSVSPGTYYDYAVDACRSGYGCSSSQAMVYSVAFLGTTSGGSVYGRVLTSSGSAVSGARVDLKKSDNVSFFINVYSGTDGSYRFANIAAGTYYLSAYPSSDRYDLAPSLAQTVTVTDGSSVLRDIPLSSGTKTITGTVRRMNGQAVGDAQVGAWRLDGPGGASAITNSAGVYTLVVSGGTWNVGVRPMATTSDWSYNKEPQSLTFVTDASVESRTVDFTVTTTNAHVSGSIKHADGSVPAASTVNVGFFNSTTRVGVGGFIGADGTFTFAIPAGTYEVNVGFSDLTFYVQPIVPISVNEGENKNIGIVTILKKAGEGIRGRVSGSGGEAVVGVEVNALNPATGNFVFAKTSSDGTYQLNVFAGTWNVSINASALGAYAYSGGTRQMTVASGSVAVLDFVLTKADSGISGTIVDSSGAVVSDFYGGVFVKAQEGFGSADVRYDGHVDRGTFALGVPPGNYQVSAFPGFGSSYMPSAPMSVTVAAGQVTKIAIVVTKNTSLIQGAVKTASGAALTGVRMRVFASNEQGFWRETDADMTNGSFKLYLAAGTWRVGVKIDNTAYIAPPPVVIAIAAGQTVSRDIIVTSAGSFISGKVTDVAGKGVANVWVSADSHSFSVAGTTRSSDVRSFGGPTDSAGAYKIAVPSGTYFMHVFLGAQPDLMAPAEQQAVATEGATTTVDLSLRAASVTVTGRALEGGTGRSAFVWAWGENGGTANTKANIDGSYALKLAPGKWRVGASFERDRILFAAAERSLDLSVVVNAALDLVLIDTRVLVPQTVVKSASATTDQLLTNDTGVQVNVPANSISSQGNVTVTVAPTADAASQGVNNIVGVAYEINALDESGNAASSLNVPVTITIPYDEKEIGADENLLKLAFWDHAVGSWQDLESAVIDTVNNIVTGSVTHLTRFALVAPADIIPPANPQAVRVNSSSSVIRLNWLNPSSDFHHARVYRSTVSAEIGAKIADNITSGAWSDTGLQKGVRYYYNVKAVDLAGNESTSAAQISAVGGQATSGVGPYPSGTLLRVGTNPTVWYIDGGKRRAVAAGVLAARFRGVTVRRVTDKTHLDLYPEGQVLGYADGTLLKIRTNPTVYIVAEGKKLPFASAEAFVGLGYKSVNIKVVRDADLALHATGAPIASSASLPSGTLVMKAGDKTVWYIDKGVRRAISSLDIFNTWKFNSRSIITVSAEKFDAIPQGSLLPYPDYTLVKGSAAATYFIENGKKRHIVSGSAFIANQFNARSVKKVPDSVIAQMVDGSDIE